MNEVSQFVVENDCHDDYCRLIWTINSCRGECFKSLRKNERPHNVNSCDKCSCTAGGKSYCKLRWPIEDKLLTFLYRAINSNYRAIN